jgi:hypothetical protein
VTAHRAAKIVPDNLLPADQNLVDTIHAYVHVVLKMSRYSFVLCDIQGKMFYHIRYR